MEASFVQAVLDGGLSFVATALGIAITGYVLTLLKTEVDGAVRRHRQRKEILIAAFVEIDNHVRRAERFADRRVTDALIATIHRIEGTGDGEDAAMSAFYGGEKRPVYRPFVVQAESDGFLRKRVDEGLFWLRPELVRALRSYLELAALEQAMVDRMHSDEFAALDTDRKVAFFNLHHGHMREVVKSGRAALRALEFYAPYDLVAALSAPERGLPKV